MSQYYCLVSGLPGLNPDDPKAAHSLPGLVASFDEVLTAKDRALIGYFMLKFDNLNLLAYLADPEAPLSAPGNLTRDDFAAIVAANHESERPVYAGMPPYFVPFLQAYLAGQEPEQFPGLAPEDQLASLYYDFACRCSNPFIARFFGFMLNVKNILTASQSRRYGYDLQKTIAGDNEIARIIRSSTAKDFGLAGELDYLDEVLKLADEPNLLERELKLDRLIWNYLDDESFFHYFSIEKVFTYLVKTDLLNRWEALRIRNGEDVFRRVIGEIKGAHRFA